MDLTKFYETNQLIKPYFFYVSVLTLKMLLMSVLTARQRFGNKAFANPEDAKMKGAKVRVDENVERVRRAHLNDLENIPLFMVVSLIYIFTNPSVTLTLMLFRAFTLARICHTLVYAVVVVPQPARAISWFVGYGITIYMAIMSAMYFVH